jgi:hypothetical protein
VTAIPIAPTSAGRGVFSPICAAASSQQSLDLAFAAMAWDASQQDADASASTLSGGKIKTALV